VCEKLKPKAETPCGSVQDKTMRLALLATAIHFLTGGIISALFLAATLTAQAEVRIDQSAEAWVELSIFGTITEADAKTFEPLYRHDLEYKNAFIELNSEGGSVSSAMQIGRIIRKYDGTTTIPKNGKCYGSCALIFIAGVVRINSGQLGLHRPYFTDAPQSREIIEKQVPLMLSMVKSYITEMGLSDDFYQQMVNTDPSKVTIYRGMESKRVVPAVDPTHQEIEMSFQARHYGVTTSEMRQRHQDMNNCEKLASPDNLRCLGPAAWGLSVRVYEEREKKVKKECWFQENKMESDKDVEALFAIPRKARPDHPITIRRETCERNIMLGR
jgi:hypothetical protein